MPRLVVVIVGGIQGWLESEGWGIWTRGKNPPQQECVSLVMSGAAEALLSEKRPTFTFAVLLFKHQK